MRVRITATVAVLVATALAGAGLIVYAIESQRIDEQTVQESQQELDEFAQSQRGGNDSETLQPFGSLREMFVSFLERNVPDDDELFVGWVGDAPDRWLPRDSFVEDPDFLRAAAALVEDGGSTRVETGRGTVLITTQPVRQGGQDGALVVVNFLAEDRAELLDTMRTYTIVSVLSLLVVVAVAFWQSGRLLRPLRAVRETAHEISETDLSRRLPVRGNDDISALTRTFNDMLERLESAFTDQRQFLDDAGHELKTPLTVLRGHLELLDVDDAVDVTETRELLLDEVDRMARLVGDLMLLAKTDRPDFLDARPVDLAHLTEVVLAKARGLGDRHWVLDATAEARVTVDEQRITQALLQLADNAVKHTADDDEIAIGSSVTDGVAHLWVRDTGPGVPVADHDRIFARFGRAVVAPDDEGFGLGLSIVSAIARAHGGSAFLDRTHAGGARFVITLAEQRES